ncbi:MAG: hypothetical protein P8P79_18130 [Halioglobus sp.]|nr:hypothetical protein [Halioglobus sp.]
MSEIKSGRRRLSNLLAGATVSAISLLGASLARASCSSSSSTTFTTISRQNGTIKTCWYVVTSEGAAISVADGTLINTAGGSYRGDAFDGAMNVHIFPSGDTDSIPLESATLDAIPTVVNNSPNGGSVSGAASVRVIDQDLGVDFSLVFASDAARVDGTFVIRNNSLSQFTGFVGIRTNFGSDDETVVEATSSGDTTVATGDTWVVTSEDNSEAPDSDPIIISAVTSAGATVGPRTDLDGNDELVWRTAVDLAPGETATVSASHCLFETIAEATEAAQAGNCAGATTTGATGGEKAIPTLTNPALLALAVLTGLLGAGNLQRRRESNKG